MGESEIQCLDTNIPYIQHTERNFTVVDGARLGKLITSATKNGPKYWGTFIGNPLMPPPNIMSSRLIILRNVLKKAPELDKEAAEWAFERSALTMKDEAEKNMKKMLTLQRKKRNRPYISLPYIEAYRESSVKKEVLGTLLEENDPAAETILALDQWKQDYEGAELTTGNLELGYKAFEVFLFSVREEKMKRYIGEIATRNHEIVYE